MADSNIKRIVVPQGSLPAAGYEKQRHQLRFRIVSEDRTAFTHWSPFFSIANDGVDLTPGFVDPTSPIQSDPEYPEIMLADFVDLVWSPPRQNRRYEYDIFVRWLPNPEDFPESETDFNNYPFELLSSQYAGNSLKAKVTNTVNNKVSYIVRFIVQLASNPNRTPVLSESPIYDSGNISLIVDTIS